MSDTTSITKYQRMSINLNGIGRTTDDSDYLKGSYEIIDGDDFTKDNNPFPSSDERYNYGVTIGYTDCYLDNVTDSNGNTEVKKIARNFYQSLDLVTSVNEHLTSQVSSYPMTDKDYVMDHMFNEPMTVSISGKFSLYGRNARIERSDTSGNVKYLGDYNKAIYSKPITRLKRIQELFEKLKEDGYVMSLTTIGESKTDGSGELLFKRRPSMILTSITWDTTNPSVLGYTFEFKEVRFATISTENMFELDSSDSNLPDITDPVSCNFTDKILNSSDIIMELLNACLDDGFVSHEFLKMFGDDLTSNTDVQKTLVSDVTKNISTYLKDSTKMKNIAYGTDGANLIFSYVGLILCRAAQGVTGVVGVTAGVATIGATLGAALAGTTVIPGVGWIVGLIAVATTVTIWGIGKLIDLIYGKCTYSVDCFKKHLISSKNHNEELRFAKFLCSIDDSISGLDDQIKAYSFSSDNTQNCYMQIDSYIYIFKFVKDTSTDNGSYNLSIVDATNEDNVVVSSQKIVWLDSILGVTNPKDYMNANGYHVYFIKNDDAISAFKSSYTGDNVEDATKAHLTNYYMIVMSYPLDKFQESLKKVLRGTYMKSVD